MTLPRLTLRPKRDKRVKSGHPWVFSNELESGFADLEPGAAADLFDSKGQFMGKGLVSPNSLIAFRIYSRARHEDLDSMAFYTGRLTEALAYRRRRWPDRSAMRLINAEGDFLPGIVIDKFNDHLAVQLTTVGTDSRRELLKAAIDQALSVESAVFRNDSRVRELEGLPLERGVWFGEPPEHVDIDEAGVTFRVPLLDGQKTGHFFDQAVNREAAAHWARDQTVLDVYCNTGGWGLHALARGAKHATLVEKSESTAQQAWTNAQLNGFAEKTEVVEAEATKLLEYYHAEGKRFGVVVLDPPAFAKSRKTAGNALRGYQKINTLGMQLTEPGGMLFTSSCSYHIEEDRFVEAISKAAKDAGRRLRLVRRGEQAPDHPMLPEVPESRYLKSYGFQVLL